MAEERSCEVHLDKKAWLYFADSLSSHVNAPNSVGVSEVLGESTLLIQAYSCQEPMPQV